MKKEENKGTTFTTLKIVGDREKVEEAVHQYLKEYPFMGYSTRLRSLRQLPNGQWEAVVSRYSSCD